MSHVHGIRPTVSTNAVEGFKQVPVVTRECREPEPYIYIFRINIAYGHAGNYTKHRHHA